MIEAEPFVRTASSADGSRVRAAFQFAERNVEGRVLRDGSPGYPFQGTFVRARRKPAMTPQLSGRVRSRQADRVSTSP